MAINRIECLDIDHRELFTAIYGVNCTSEIFMTKDMCVYNLKEALYYYLKEQGYAPVFYDNKLFSYEEQHLLDFLCLDVGGDTAFNCADLSAPKPAEGKKDFFKGRGPFGTKRDVNKVKVENGELTICATQSIQPASNTNGTTHHSSVHVETHGNQRVYMVLLGESFLRGMFTQAKRNPQKKVAVVFVSPGTLLMTPEQSSVYVSMWKEAHSDFKRNNLGLRIIALYDFASAEAFVKKLDEHSSSFLLQSPFKENILNDLGGTDKENYGATWGRGKTVFFMQPPGIDEISNLLNYRHFITKDLPHLFNIDLSLDEVVCRLWQGGEMKSGNNKTVRYNLLVDMKESSLLDNVIECMDTQKAEAIFKERKGIDNIKLQFEHYCKALNDHRQGFGGGRFRPHMVMMGSPGTGKSTVAKMFGEILREKHLLPKGHFVKVSVDELIGEYVGHTRPKTRAVCERARGGVLFIDEAYGLMSGTNSHGTADFGKEAIEVLIQFMEDNDDSLVILAGYTDEINYLLDEGNKGFRRRIQDPIGYFKFQDYSPEVLYQIALDEMIPEDIKDTMTESFKKALSSIIRCKHAYKNKKFGNVGEIENLVNYIINTYRQAVNQSEEKGPLDVKWLPDELRMLVDDSMLDEAKLLAELNGIVGQDEVKQMVRQLYTKVLADRTKLRVFDNYIPTLPDLKFLFTGNPGTGKTTIARIVGKLLRDLGVFPSSYGDVLVEKSGNDLLTLSPDDMKKLFEDCIGKVLFIDEAYQLKDSPRIVADIVGNTELLDYKNKLSVIMAGYPDDIQAMINVNHGMRRRFKKVMFNDYTNEELFEILVRKIESTPFAVMDAEQCRETALRLFESYPRNQSFGNAGEVENLVHTLLNNREERYVNGVKQNPQLASNTDFSQRILPEDFPQPIQNDSAAAKGNTYEHPLRYNGIIDCSAELDETCVTSGGDIYSSVGLIENIKGSGTGFIISVTNRYIMTASHVIENCADFKFTLNIQNRLFQTQARLIWNHPDHDFAILQAEELPNEAKHFRIDTATPRNPGTELSIAAFPLGTQVSSQALLTQGCISNYEPNLRMIDHKGIERQFTAIRTEAQATHGSSGSPVMLADTMLVIGVLHGGMNEEGFFMNVASDIRQLLNDPTLAIRI